jgi:hypothetical protein
MFHATYEKMVQFASQGALAEELARARGEYVSRTGDMFESDPSYERRIAAFLEWYVLDRPVSTAPQMTPAKLYIEHMLSTKTTPELSEMRNLTRTHLSLFEFKRAKSEQLRVVDLLTGDKVDVFERRKPAGLESGDILEARLVPHGDTYMFSEAIGVHPREARKPILAAAKRFKKSGSEEGRIDLVHRCAYFANRAERYSHVDPKEIFAPLLEGTAA